MSQRMIVAVKFFYLKSDAGSVKSPNDITDYLQKKGWKVWHWLADIWLLTGVPDDVSPRILWEDLKVGISFPELNGVVINHDTSAYWGNLAKESWDWMRDNWGQADLPASPPSGEPPSTAVVP
jgi:hypothetical protein